MHGDLPPPCLTHSATLVGQKLIIIARGERASYYSVHIFDIPDSQPGVGALDFHHSEYFPGSTAHTMVLYQSKSSCSEGEIDCGR